MQLGLIGLGRMGGNMRDRLRAAGHEVVGYDPRPEVSDVDSLASLAAALDAPRVVWVMVPSVAMVSQNRIVWPSIVLSCAAFIAWLWPALAPVSRRIALVILFVRMLGESEREAQRAERFEVA